MPTVFIFVVIAILMSVLGRPVFKKYLAIVLTLLEFKNILVHTEIAYSTKALMFNMFSILNMYNMFTKLDLEKGR